MNFGKHSGEALKIKQSEEAVLLKDKEIKDIKTECADQFKKIKDLCVCNSYNGQLDKLKKIYEIASDNFSALILDIVIYDEPEEKGKIIELSNTRKSK